MLGNAAQVQVSLGWRPPCNDGVFLNEKNRPETAEWLEQQGVQYHKLLLRGGEVYRSDAVAKREILQGLDLWL